MAVEYFMVFGYLLISMAVGVFCMGAAVDIWRTRKEGKSNHSSENIVKSASILSVTLVIIGIAFTLFHLGRMGHFYNIILNFDSWLTREAWSAGSFTFVSIVYYLLWRKKAAAQNSSLRNFVGIVGIILGITTILSMSMIYGTVKAIPAWNTTLILYMNLANAFGLGVFLFGLVLAFNYNKAKSEESLNKLRSFTLVGVLAVILVGATYLTYQIQLASLPQIIGMDGNTGLVVSRIGIGILLPLLIIMYAWFNRNKKASLIPMAFVSSFVLVVAGDIMARMLHFLIAIQTPIIPPIF